MLKNSKIWARLRRLTPSEFTIQINSNFSFIKISVIGFELFYKLGDGDYLKACHNTPENRKIKHQMFEIGPDDYIKEISGLYEVNKNKSKIINITFLSYRGKFATFGCQRGESFKFTFENHTFSAFKGGYFFLLII